MDWARDVPAVGQIGGKAAARAVTLDRLIEAVRRVRGRFDPVVLDLLDHQFREMRLCYAGLERMAQIKIEIGNAPPLPQTIPPHSAPSAPSA